MGFNEIARALFTDWIKIRVGFSSWQKMISLMKNSRPNSKQNCSRGLLALAWEDLKVEGWHDQISTCRPPKMKKFSSHASGGKMAITDYDQKL